MVLSSGQEGIALKNKRGGDSPRTIIKERNNMEELEIEKKFLLTDEQAQSLLKEAPDDGIQMVDYYVPNTRGHMDLRIRKKGKEYCITRKTPVEGGVMKEVTIPIGELEFMFLTHGIVTSVSKVRFKIKFEGHDAELDIYDGRHAGINMLEIEFPNKQAFDDLQLQHNLQDITGIEKWAAGKLAEL